MWLDKCIKETGVLTDYPCFADDIECVCKVMKASDLFLAHCYNGDFSAMDVVVKYLAVENFYNINSFGLKLYHKMQLKRVGEDWTDRFISLMQSFEKNGIDMSSWINTDLDYSIHDGAHRLALALFHNIEDVPVKIFNLRIQRRYYGINWFRNNGFDEIEIKLILDKYNELLEKCRKPYYCILWPPANGCKDEIISDIINYDDTVHVIDSFKYRLREDELKEFIYSIYATDDIEKYKLDLKYEHLINSMRFTGWENGYCEITVIRLRIDFPDFRLKPLSGLPQSKVSMRLKRTIRDRYQDRIFEYYYDIIMHLTDNQHQNVGVEEILRRNDEAL